MSESKIYRITGQIDKPFLFEPIIFKKEISALEKRKSELMDIIGKWVNEAGGRENR